ncbi:MAG: hypothetical protein NZ455_11115 [Bacteroidia bacterium]|nr:hypothetical protein [Bacteroidia bacterium]MDW8347410.1 hypothetical protein [Bacteroidia bacterium]
MRRVRQQCVAQRSTEAIAQPAARRPEHSEGHVQENKLFCEIEIIFVCSKISGRFSAF